MARITVVFTVDFQVPDDLDNDTLAYDVACKIKDAGYQWSCGRAWAGTKHIGVVPGSALPWINIGDLVQYAIEGSSRISQGEQSKILSKV